MSTDIKLPKAQISKIIPSGGFLGRLFDPLLNTGLPLVENVIKPLAKSVLIPLGLTAAASAGDAGIQKKILGSGTTTLIISNEEMNNIMKILQVLEDSNILLKGVTKAIKNETKKQRGDFLSMLIIGNLLSGKGIVKAGYGSKQGEGIVTAGYGSSIKKKSLIAPHPLTNSEIQKYYENEPRFNGVYSRDNLPKK